MDTQDSVLPLDIPGLVQHLDIPGSLVHPVTLVFVEPQGVLVLADFLDTQATQEAEYQDIAGSRQRVPGLQDSRVTPGSVVYLGTQGFAGCLVIADFAVQQDRQEQADSVVTRDFVVLAATRDSVATLGIADSVDFLVTRVSVEQQEREHQGFQGIRDLVQYLGTLDILDSVVFQGIRGSVVRQDQPELPVSQDTPDSVGLQEQGQVGSVGILDFAELLEERERPDFQGTQGSADSVDQACWCSAHRPTRITPS